MMALLLKDVFLIRKRNLIMLFAIAIFVVLAGAQGGLVNTVMATMMPLLMGFTTLAYDQNDGWEAYACALPFSRIQIVKSKYVLALISIAVSMLLVLIVGLAASVLELKTMLSNAVTQFSFGSLFVAINYPLILKFGFEKSRLYYILVMIGLMSIGSALSTFQKGPSMPVSLAFALPVAALAGLIASYFLSCTIMKNKEFSGS